MKPETWTGWFIVLWVVAPMVWSRTMYKLFGREATISLVVARWTAEYPCLAFCVGVLVGLLAAHLWEHIIEEVL